MTKTYELLDEQIEELRECAIAIVEADNLEKLSWDEAWAGIYPQKPTEQQVREELNELLTKTTRILSGNYDFEHEHASLRERIRLIHLEACQTFDIWMNVRQG